MRESIIKNLFLSSHFSYLFLPLCPFTTGFLTLQKQLVFSWKQIVPFVSVLGEKERFSGRVVQCNERRIYSISPTEQVDLPQGTPSTIMAGLRTTGLQIIFLYIILKLFKRKSRVTLQTLTTKSCSAT